MKDKLRELVIALTKECSESDKDSRIRVATVRFFLKKMLSILDAEGDGGAVEDSTGSYLAHITANQAQNLLDYFGGESTTYVLIRCKEGECAPEDSLDGEDGKPSPAGLYIYDANCPEEGVIYLGDEDEESKPTEIATHPARSGVVSDATPEMCDSVRYLLVGMEQAGRTFGSVRNHCRMSGMDIENWPHWTANRETEHFNKAACAALIWWLMHRAATQGERHE